MNRFFLATRQILGRLGPGKGDYGFYSRDQCLMSRVNTLIVGFTEKPPRLGGLSLLPPVGRVGRNGVLVAQCFPTGKAGIMFAPI